MVWGQLLFLASLLIWQLAAAHEVHRENTEVIVKPDTLIKQVQQKNHQLVLVDVRPEMEYTAGHIPGAINLPVEKTFEGYRIVSLKKIRELLSLAGIHNSDHLVLYDDGYLKSAAHVFWVLEIYGQERVTVLDGGLPGWTQAGGELSREVVTRPRSQYVPTISPGHLATKLATRLAIDNPRAVIIDSRKEAEYQGQESKAARAGHIPRAVNIPATSNLTIDDGIPMLREREEIRSLYGGIGKTEHVMTYCNRGQDSAMTYLILRSLGYDISVYDGGWLEWGNDPSLPINAPDRAGTAKQD